MGGQVRQGNTPAGRPRPGADGWPHLDELPTLPREQLIALWQRLVGRLPAPKTSRDLLVRVVAYELQLAAIGGIPKNLQRRLDQLVAELENPRPRRASAQLRPGDRLLRIWHGEAHEIVVLDSGFIWRGTRFASLSEIARAITGTRWSGPAFFGLKAKAGAKASALRSSKGSGQAR